MQAALQQKEQPAPPKVTVVLRAASQGDQAFVMDSWLRSFGKGRTWVFRGVEGDRFYSGHREILENILQRSLVVVACLEEVPDAVLGWACIEPGCVHYTYVKNKYRRKGVATKLIAHAEKLMGTLSTCSHQTGQWKRFTPGQKLMFTPAHAFYKPTGEKHGA